MVSVMIAAAQVATDIVPDLGRCGDWDHRYMVSVMIAAAQVATDIVPDLGRCGDSPAP